MVSFAMNVKRMRRSRCSLKKQVFNVNTVCFKCLDFFFFFKKYYLLDVWLQDQL